MKKFTIFILAILATSFVGWAQTTIDFETDGVGYTPSSTYGSGITDIFNRVNPDIGGNSSYLWAAEDITANETLTLDQISVSGASSFTFSIDFLTPNTNDWDSTDELLITYSLDGGAYQNLMWVQAIDDDDYNEPAALDLAFDGAGDYGQELPAITDDHGAGVGNTFQTFTTAAIPLSGNSTLDILLSFNSFTSNDEGIYLDNITVTPVYGGNNPPVIENITQTPSADIGTSTTVSVSADVTDTDGTISTVELYWGTASGSLTNTISMTASGDTYTTSTPIPAQSGGTTVYYEIEATDDDMDATVTSEYSYTVYPFSATLPFTETFDASLGGFYTYSALGATKGWNWGVYGGNGFADINGYDSGETENDWLISPEFNLDMYSNELLTFDTWYGYGTDDANNYLKLHYSTDYSGVGDPSSATWYELAYNQGDEWNWTNAGLVDVSGISGTSVFFAFEYNYEAGNYRHWEVDNFNLFEASLVDVTFQVNLEEQMVTTGVNIAGEFNGWNPTATPMTNTYADVYEVTIQLYQGLTYQFKYIYDGNWESVPAECEYPGTDNRFETIGSSAYTLPLVCYGSCSDCGSPDWNITFRVDMKNETVTGDVYLAGDFNGWSNQTMTNTYADVYELTVLLEEGTYHTYKFKNGPDGWESFIGECVVWDYGDRYMTTPTSDAVLDLVCFNSCEACPVSTNVMINEVDADDYSGDDLEFIELYDGGVGNTDLSGLVVVLFNGSDNLSYSPAIDLDGYATDANGYFVIGDAGVTGVDIVMSNDFLQNGADAVALFIGDETEFPNDTPIPGDLTNLIDALVYDTSDSDDPDLLTLLNPGEPQINENGRGNKDYHSNQRIPNGSGGMRNTYTYDQSPPTPDAPNSSIYTDWTGDVDANWNDAGNWTNGVPTAGLNAAIGDVTPNAFPVLGGGSGGACNDLFIGSGANVTIAPTATLTVNGSFDNWSGSAGLTIQSDATGTGSLLHNSAGVSATVQTYLSGGQWHGVSAPINNALSGVFLGIYLEYFVEATDTWEFIIPEDVSLPAGSGYYAWYADNITVTYDGELNNGDVSPTINYTTGAPANAIGWNIIGNPFASAVEWTGAWPSTNVDATMYMYDGVQYLTWNGSVGTKGNGDAQVGSAFFIRANATAPAITIPQAARKHSSEQFYKEAVEGLFSFNIEGNDYYDKMMVQFADDATIGFDSQYDAYKLDGNDEAPQMYMNFSNTRLTVNALPFANNLTIPVSLEVSQQGTYELNAEFEDAYTVILEDLLTGTFTELSSGSSIAINASPEDDANRFVLHFSGVNSIDDELANAVSIYSYQDHLYVKGQNIVAGQLEVFDILGKSVYAGEINGSDFYQIQLAGTDGYYIVKLVTDSETIVEKLRLK